MTDLKARIKNTESGIEQIYKILNSKGLSTKTVQDFFDDYANLQAEIDQAVKKFYGE